MDELQEKNGLIMDFWNDDVCHVKKVKMWTCKICYDSSVKIKLKTYKCSTCVCQLWVLT